MSNSTFCLRAIESSMSIVCRTTVRRSVGDFAARASPGKIEQLPDDGGHLVGFRLDGRRTLGNLVRIELAGGNQSRAAGDDVQRCTQFMGDARGQPADRLEAVGVAKLLQGDDPRGGLLAKLVLRIGQLRAEGVEVFGQFCQFVAGAQAQGASQVAFADPPGLGHQLL